MTTPILDIRNLTASYGRISAISGISVTVGSGDIVSVVGPNGAGKTTLLNAIAGLLPASGEVILNGESIAGAADRSSVITRSLSCVGAT